jgi:hypothetical protein
VEHQTLEDDAARSRRDASEMQAVGGLRYCVPGITRRMMNSITSLGTRLSLLLMLTYGCSQPSHGCEAFPHEYSRLYMRDIGKTRASLNTPAIKIASAKIAECYPRHRFMGYEDKLEILEARADDSGNYFIIWELYGVDDLLLVFKADRSGNVVGSYQSTLQ